MPSRPLTVGDVTITALSDGHLEFTTGNFFPALPPETWDGCGHFLTPERKLRFSLTTYLIRTEGRNVLVDTGMGPKPADQPGATYGMLLDDLLAAGTRPDEIDMVVMTHLHRDHVGWNLRQEPGKFAPTFPKATYHVSVKDWEVSHRPEVMRERFPNAPYCVWPLAELDLGQLKFMDGETALTRHLTAIPTPGHTPGHCSILVASQGQQALILGDAAHSPAQVERPEWVSRADMLPEVTQQTRRKLWEKLAEDGTLVCAGHFPAPNFGHIVTRQGRRYWQGLD